MSPTTREVPRVARPVRRARRLSDCWEVDDRTMNAMKVNLNRLIERAERLRREADEIDSLVNGIVDAFEAVGVSAQ